MDSQGTSIRKEKHSIEFLDFLFGLSIQELPSMEEAGNVEYQWMQTTSLPKACFVFSLTGKGQAINME